MVRIGSSFRAVRIAAASLLVAGCALFSSGVVPSGRAPAEARVTPAPDRAAANRPPRARPRHEVASWYGAWHQGRPTASGEAYDVDGLTAAHRSFPLGTCVEVVHLANGRRVFVRVNDRGPYLSGRTIDLSYRAAQELEMLESGLARVRIHRAKPEACEQIGG